MKSVLALAVAVGLMGMHLGAVGVREIVGEKKVLNLPVKNGAKVRKARVMVEGREVRQFTIECAEGEADWWAGLDISEWKGKAIRVEVEGLSGESRFLQSMEQGEGRKGMEGVYREALRPQLHFSPQRGWNNDPNGLVYFKGEYHLFFQHNPYGVKWGNMHWGHAVSRDLVHWEEIGIALYPDAMGTMYSGSAVVDWKNTSGLGAEGRPALVLIYTAAGSPFTQGIAYSTDGRTFTKYAGNPVVKHIAGSNRDPKVIWHEGTKSWVMALYVDHPAARGEDGKKVNARQTIRFLSSADLIHWTAAGEVEGFHECPDLFELPLDGDAGRMRWILTAANSDYMVGQFDGKGFVPDGPGKIRGHVGKGFYAAQTFSDIPSTPPADGRRIMIGWFQTPAPGMVFNQSMSVPLEVKLVSTAAGPRLSYLPVKELEALRVKSKKMEAVEMKPGGTLAVEAGELVEVRMEVEPEVGSEVTLNVRGVAIRYDAGKQELGVGNVRGPLPLLQGRVKLRVLVDRNGVEIFGNDGVTYLPCPMAPGGDVRSVLVSTLGGKATVHSLEVHTLKSIWER